MGYYGSTLQLPQPSIIALPGKKKNKIKQKEKKMYHTKLMEEILAFLVGFIVLRIFLGRNVRDAILCHNSPCGEL